ncbi:MAG TPA: VTT domain-containing protein, partial [Xanthomonadales bacterium]|nr:VTT domain-containing protein [Xanthomonadales bacterium]
CAMAGALVSGWFGFLLGSLLGGKILQRLSGSQIHKLSQRLSERGVMAVAMLRLLPVAPYTVVNLAAGASHLKQGQFLAGSAIGLAPGVGALTLFSGSLYQAVVNPSMKSLGLVALVVVIIVAAALMLRRMLKMS